MIPQLHRCVFNRFVATAFAVLAASACSQLQPVDLPAEYTAPPAQSEVWQALEADHPDDWFVLLNEGPDALDWRLRAIDTATESIELQTFLWKFDIAGSLVLDHLLNAAERGVTIKLLVDDTFLLGEDQILLALADHPNIEYRVFNPYKRRTDGFASRMLLNIGEFGRLDHRMHNKAMIVDSRIAIIGGRNIADEYFGLHGNANFRDLELIVGGPIVAKAVREFDDYWNDRWAFPIEMLSHERASEQQLEEARVRSGGNAFVHREESVEERLERWQILVDNSVSGRATLLLDKPPEGNPDDASEAPVQVAKALVSLIESAQQEIVIVSAYLIPSSNIEELFAETIARGVRIRVLTNSIASNNHLTAHSAYRKHVTELLNNGTELHEIKTDAESRNIYILSSRESHELALHAKALIVDDDKVFIGSPNLDPRSMRLNTEMGLLVESEALNQWVRDVTTPDFEPVNAWRLQFDDNNEVIWVSEDEVLEAQPANSFMQRIEDWFFGFLPMEGEL